MNFQKEANFILKKYFTNGFTIWAFLMLITYYSRNESVIAEFRDSLWLDQLMLVFLVPLFSQVVLDAATRIRRIKEFPIFSKTMFLYVIVSGGIGWILMIDFSFFQEESY